MQSGESFLCTALIGIQEKQQDFHVFQTGFKFFLSDFTPTTLSKEGCRKTQTKSLVLTYIRVKKLRSALKL